MELSWHIKRKARCNLGQMGYAWNQYSVLKDIGPGESLTLSKLAQRVGRHMSNVTPIIDFLVEKDMVARFQDSSDRRVIRIALTEEGIKKRNELIKIHEDFIINLYKGINQSELETFYATMSNFLERIGE